MGRGGTIAHRTFPASPWRNSFKVSVFGRTEAIKRCSNVLGRDPLKRALLPTLPGRTLVCHCPAHEECHADALAQACESEVMIHPEVFVPRNPPAKRHKFCHGAARFLAIRRWWRCAQLGRLAQTGISDIVKDLRHAIAEIVSKHGLHSAARAAWAVRSRSPFVRDKHNDDIILAATKSCLQSAGFHPNLSVLPNQPFRPALMRNLLRQTLASSILPSHVSTRVCPNQYGSLVSGAATNRSARRCAFENLRHELAVSQDPDTVSRPIQEDIDAKFVQEFHVDIAQAAKRWPKGGGQLAASASPGRTTATRTSAWKSIPSTRRSKVEKRSNYPCVEDIASAKVVSHASEGVGLTTDVSKARKRLRIREDAWGLLFFQHLGKLHHHNVCHFGARFCAAWWSRMGAVLTRICHQCLFIQHGGWLYVDDFLFAFGSDDSAANGNMHLLGCPISWKKKELGRQVRWIGLDIKIFWCFWQTLKGAKPFKSSIKYLDKEAELSAPTWNFSWAFRCGWPIPCQP